MVDPHEVERANARYLRRMQIAMEMGEPGADTEALLRESAALSAEDDAYLAGLVAEIKADHIIRTEAVEVVREEAKEQLDHITLAFKGLAADDPRRQRIGPLLPFLTRFAEGETLSEDDLAKLMSLLDENNEGNPPQ